MDSLPVISPVAALVLFAIWTILLVTLIGVWRVGQLLTGSVPQGGFKPGTQHGSDTYWRLNRAHMNAVENLPIFATVVLAGLVLGVQDPMFQTLATVVLIARVAQSLIHISSGLQAVIMLRFMAYLVQVVAMLGLAVIDLKASGFVLPF